MRNSYIALDLETTGLRPDTDRILEIGAVKVEEGEVTGTFSTFIDCGIPIPPFISELTGNHPGDGFGKSFPEGRADSVSGLFGGRGASGPQSPLSIMVL